MKSKSALHIAHGISLFGLALCATLLEIFDKDPDFLWLGVFIWVCHFFWDTWPDNSSDEDSDFEERVECILREKGLLQNKTDKRKTSGE